RADATVDRRGANDGAPLRLHAGLFPPLLRVRVSPRTGAGVALWSRARLPALRGRAGRVLVRQSADTRARSHSRRGPLASRRRGFCAVLRLHAPRLPAVPTADEGEGRERREVCEAQCVPGRRFDSWGALNAWLEEWCLTVAD